VSLGRGRLLLLVVVVGLRLGRRGRLGRLRLGLGLVLLGGDAGDGRRLEGAERQERGLEDERGLDVDDAVARDRGADDLGADRERAARAGGGLRERLVAVGGRVDPEAAERAGRLVDELGEDADRPAPVVVDQERRPLAEPDRASLEAVLPAVDDADLAIRDDDSLDRPLVEVGEEDLALESQHGYTFPGVRSGGVSDVDGMPSMERASARSTMPASRSAIA
jgi:hypothetical protein